MSHYTDRQQAGHNTICILEVKRESRESRPGHSIVLEVMISVLMGKNSTVNIKG